MEDKFSVPESGAPPGGLILASLLLNRAGDCCAADDRFYRIFPDVGSVSAETLEGIFPPGFRPKDLLRARHSSQPAGDAAACHITLPGGDTLRVHVDLERMGEWWQLRLNEFSPQVSAFPLLIDYLSAQDEVARYLHNTVSQGMVALSLALTRLQESMGAGPGPLLKRTLDLCDKSGRDLRVLNAALAASISIRPKSDNVDLISAVKWYVRSLRADAGLDLSLASDGTRATVPVRLGWKVRTLLRAFLQRWAEAALNAGTPARILPILEPTGLEVRILADQPHDPAMKAVLSSALLQTAARELGATLRSDARYPGSSACLVFPGRAGSEGDAVIIGSPA